MNLIIARRMIALAALLAATVMAAWDLRSTNSSSETLTVYQDAPALHLLDHGPPGNSPGDVHHFFAPLHSIRRLPLNLTRASLSCARYWVEPAKT